MLAVVASAILPVLSLAPAPKYVFTRSIVFIVMSTLVLPLKRPPGARMGYLDPETLTVHQDDKFLAVS